MALKFDALIDVMPSAAKAASKAAAKRLAALSKPQVPVDTSALVKSLRVASYGPTSASVSYNTPYAIYVHEDLAMNHPRGGKAKFLEDPLRENAKALGVIMSDVIRKSIDGGSSATST
jgi:hypothetical protein